MHLDGQRIRLLLDWSKTGPLAARRSAIRLEAVDADVADSRHRAHLCKDISRRTARTVPERYPHFEAYGLAHELETS